MTSPATPQVKIVARALRDVTLVHPAIKTNLSVDRHGLHIALTVKHRDTGKLCQVQFTWQVPSYVLSHDDAVDWIYDCVRDTWVHELNEALHVRRDRRFVPHDANGEIRVPPDENSRREVERFKRQLANFLLRSKL